jgi:hypothetical protein
MPKKFLVVVYIHDWFPKTKIHGVCAATPRASFLLIATPTD